MTLRLGEFVYKSNLHIVKMSGPSYDLLFVCGIMVLNTLYMSPILKQDYPMSISLANISFLSTNTKKNNNEFDDKFLNIGCLSVTPPHLRS